MGYWEEKKEYEEEKIDKDFCSVCGRALTNRNIKGRCVSCEEVICVNCGKIQEGKVTCSDCIEGVYKGDGTFKNMFKFGFKKMLFGAKKEMKKVSRKKHSNNFVCIHCNNTFKLGKELFEDYKEGDNFSFKCPHCKKDVKLD